MEPVESDLGAASLLGVLNSEKSCEPVLAAPPAFCPVAFHQNRRFLGILSMKLTFGRNLASIITVVVAAIAVFSAVRLRGEEPARPGRIQIEASEDVSSLFPGAPRLQSFAWAQWDGKWIFIGGRTGGYHGIGQGDVDFPRSRANLKIWVVEPSDSGPARTYSFAVADLPATLAIVKDQWVASNLLHFQDRDMLYLAGGYGQNTAGDLVTYPILSAVNLPALIQGVMQGKDTFSGKISWVESALVQSTGGDLVKLDDGFFYLVGGHVFMGTYRAFEAQNEKNTAKVYQTYLSEIRKLRVKTAAPGKLTVELAERFRNQEFARRDGNAALTILPDGKTLGAGVYGGVFTKDQLNFTHPIYFSPGGPPAVDTVFEQKMSAYACAKMSIFDPTAEKMYTTFFGGISRWTWNYQTSRFEQSPVQGDKTKESGYLDGMPWIDQISTLVRGTEGTTETVQPANRLPAYIGTNAAFLTAPGIAKFRPDTDILAMRQFRGKRILAGYIYGGIRAYPKQFPYTDEAPSYSSGNVPTKPSDLILKVYVSAPPVP
jgi:hypothetical protein